VRDSSALLKAVAVAVAVAVIQKKDASEASFLSKIFFTKKPPDPEAWGLIR